MEKLEYEPSVDYQMLLLEFASKNKHLLCSNFEQTVDAFLDMVRGKRAGYSLGASIYPPAANIPTNKKIYEYYSALEYMLYCRNNAMKKKYSSTNYIFLTVNFDDTTKINGNIMLSLARQVCHVNAEAGVPLFTSGIFVLEKNRKDDKGKLYIHHHVHFLFKLSVHLRASKIAEKVFALAGMKDYCKKVNFIDVKTPNAKKIENRAQPYEVCEAYVMGQKCDDKAECIGADILWRLSLGLDDVYAHN